MREIRVGKADRLIARRSLATPWWIFQETDGASAKGIS
jgi:hypothetical protein